MRTGEGEIGRVRMWHMQEPNIPTGKQTPCALTQAKMNIYKDGKWVRGPGGGGRERGKGRNGKERSRIIDMQPLPQVTVSCSNCKHALIKN